MPHPTENVIICQIPQKTLTIISFSKAHILHVIYPVITGSLFHLLVFATGYFVTGRWGGWGWAVFTEPKAVSSRPRHPVIPTHSHVARSFSSQSSPEKVDKGEDDL
jgi:hypothetical protein